MMSRLFILVLLVLCGCSTEEKVETTRFTGVTMTIPYKVLVGDTLSIRQEEEISQIIAHTFASIDTTCNPYNPDSEISQINRMGAHQVVTLSPTLQVLLQKTEQVVQWTDGRFDPTIAPLQQLWKQHWEQKTVPSTEEVEALLPALGWSRVHLESNQFWKEHSSTQLDLCGIAKGYAVDLLTEFLQEAGYQNLYVEWGGEIRTQGKHPEDRPWRVFISRLGDPDPAHAVDIVSLHDQALATSGNYYQRWECAGTTYTHILDPKTGVPLAVTDEAVESVTVQGPDCATADALATTLMLLTLPEAESFSQQFKESHPEYSFWLVN